MFEALGIQHAMRMHHIVICGFSGSKITVLSYKQHKELIGHELNVLILSTTFAVNISHSKMHWAR
jgi:hypothetical protein